MYDIMEHIFSPVTFDDPRKPGEWIKFNVRQLGFYRINYPAEMWADLSHILLNNPQVGQMITSYSYFVIHHLSYINSTVFHCVVQYFNQAYFNITRIFYSLMTTICGETYYNHNNYHQ